MSGKGELPHLQGENERGKGDNGKSPDEPKVRENYNRIVNAENIFVGTTREEGFITIDLDALQDLPAPERTSEFADRARKQGLIILGGPYGEKLDVARQVARFLVDGMPTPEDEATPIPPKIREKSQHQNHPSLLLAIQREKPSAILILADLRPQSLDHNLLRIREKTKPKLQVVIITTEDSRDSWATALQDGMQECWVELNQEGLFRPEKLASELVRLVDQERKANRLPEKSFVSMHESRKSKIGDVSLQEIARRLWTPKNIAFFVDQLCSLDKDSLIDRETVERLIADAVDIKRQIEKWFNASLLPEEQLLAIGLNFFDGLRDDQCFAALEQWVKHIRSHRDPSQRAFDYADVYKLKNYFSEVKDDSLATRFASRNARFRQSLFHIAWRGHRRQILAALPLLTRLVFESAATDSIDWELYGSQEQRGQLRAAVSRTLSELGRLSTGAVERALVMLAGHAELEVQKVAALAMATWREGGTSRELFQMLDRWLGGYGRQASSQDAPPRQGNMEEDPRVYIVQTVALTVAWAAEADPPGQLSGELMRFLNHLALDERGPVRGRFIQVLKYVMALHLAQLRDERLLHHLVKLGPEFELIVGASLASAYTQHPEQVKNTLELFQAESEKPKDEGPTRIALLSTIAYAYGSIKYEQGGQLTLTKGFEWFQKRLAGEDSPRLRQAVIMAAAFQAIRNFQQVAPLMQELMSDVRVTERAQILSILMAIYLMQREEQQGGVRLDGRDYPVWLDAPRPPTEIESAMVAWSKSPETPKAQQIALQASIAFAQGVEQEESRFVQKEQEVRAKVRREDAARQAARQSAPSPQPGRYTLRFVPWLATRFTWGREVREQHQLVVSGLLPEALAQNRRQGETLSFVLKKWQQQGDGDTRAIVAKLKDAISWHPYAGWLLVFGGALVLLIIVILLHLRT